MTDVGVKEGAIAQTERSFLAQVEMFSFKTGTMRFQMGAIPSESFANALQVGMFSPETGAFRLQIGTMLFQTGTIVLQTGTIALQIGMKRFQIGIFSSTTEIVSLWSSRIGKKPGFWSFYML